MKNEKKVARVIVVNPDGSIIMHRRPDWSKLAPNKLSILGGKFEPSDETRKHAAQREIQEELGITAEINEFLFLEASENNGWITFAFILLLDETYNPEQMPNHEEFDAVTVVAAQNIIELIQSGEIAFDHPKILEKFLQIINN